MKTFTLRKSLSKVGKNLLNKLSGCAYCPLRENCELRKEKEGDKKGKETYNTICK